MRGAAGVPEVARRAGGGLRGKVLSAPRAPEDWPRAFELRLAAGDLEGVVDLYEEDACFVPRSGETLVGRAAIRPVLAGLIAARTRFASRVVRATTVGGVAVLYTDFDGTALDAAGRTVPVRSRAIEVLRRQPDGTWKLAIGDPNGRG